MIKARLFAMGTQRELLSTQLTYYRTVNPKTGRSGPIPMGGLITLGFASGNGDDRLLRWITHSPKGELCTLTAAKVVFYEGDLDGSTLFEYKLHDAALVHWQEGFKATGITPMTVTMTISAAIQTIKGITWTKTWQESRVLSQESAARKERVQRGVSDDLGKQEVVLGAAKSSSLVTNIGKKLDFIFGKATGRFHNIQRSTAMQRQLNSIGIFDNAAGRIYLNGHLGKALNNSKNILSSEGGFITRESLLMGPNGGLRMQSVWKGQDLITIKLMGR